MVKIRLMRIGAKKRPFYRVVAVDERKKRTGSYLELLGTYNPLTEPHEVILKQDRIDEWLKKGAVPSVGFLRIIGKATQRTPRKPKKEKKEEAPTAPAPEVPTEGTPTEESSKVEAGQSSEEASANEPAADNSESTSGKEPIVDEPASEPTPTEEVTPDSSNKI